MQRKINYKGGRCGLSRDELREAAVFFLAAEQLLTCCCDQRLAPLLVSGPSCLGLADLANCCGDAVKAANSSAPFLITTDVPEEVLSENNKPKHTILPQRGLEAPPTTRPPQPPTSGPFHSVSDRRIQR